MISMTITWKKNEITKAFYGGQDIHKGRLRILLGFSDTPEPPVHAFPIAYRIEFTLSWDNHHHL